MMVRVRGHINDSQAKALHQVVLVLECFLKVVTGIDEMHRLLGTDAGDNMQEIRRGSRKGRGNHNALGVKILKYARDTLFKTQRTIDTIQV